MEKIIEGAEKIGGGEKVLDAEARIMEISGEMRVMGANDGEFDAVKEILERFRSGQCTSEQAVGEVEEIKYQKQDYH